MQRHRHHGRDGDLRLPVMILLIRHFLPGARLRVRLDRRFAHPAVLDQLDAVQPFGPATLPGGTCGRARVTEVTTSGF